MKIIPVIFFLLLVCANVSYGQSRKCQVLTALLQYKDSKKVWLLDQYPTLPIIFVDTKQYFSNCLMADYHQRKVGITHDSIYLNNKNVSYLTIKDFQAHAGKYKVVVFQRNTNALVEAEVSEDGEKKMIISKFKTGHF